MSVTRLIGLTGNIATGKSTVMQMAAECGATTIDADKIGHDILRQPLVKHDIRLLFGDGVFDAQGEVDRARLGPIVFQDPALLRRLEQITHPAIRQEISRCIRSATTPIVFIEAIKLLEGPLKQLCHQIWVTVAEPEQQVARLINDRGMDERLARQRVAAQSPQADKVAQADVVIDSGGTLDATRRQFEQAWQNLGQREQ